MSYIFGEYDCSHSKTKDQKDMLYIKIRALVIANPCGIFNINDMTFREYTTNDYTKLTCPCCKHILFYYDCLIDNQYVIRSIDLHVLRYHRDTISPEVLEKVKQITGVVD